MKNFNLHTTLRVLLISATSVLAAFSIASAYYFSAVTIIFLLVLQIILLLRYIGKTNTYIKQFLENIRYNDFSDKFQTEGLGSSFDELGKTFDSVIKDFQNIRSEKEEQYQILQNIIHHINVGIMVYKENGDVILDNAQFRSFLNLQSIDNILEHSKYNPDLIKIFNQLKTTKRTMFKRVVEDDILQLAIFRSEFKLKEDNLTLLTVYNIQPELDENEMEAWQKLIRVLTHEIMNSITPISSLSGTLKGLMQTKESIIEQHEDITQAIQSIERRSKGLIDFVDKYRSLTKIHKPDFIIIRIKPFLEHCIFLIGNECSQKNIETELFIENDDLEIFADEHLLEQVVINILKNACQAVENIDHPEISIKALVNNHGQPEIQVIDNGLGILPEVMDKIFIPFYTTKKEGSGIGLSLCRQIMKLHGGSIFVQSEPEKTSFSLRFR
ncbi:MAG: GHKL domain-containing protein [Bacteroidales bacterium]|nr:GHKL domain-containing protein [Bacteroidales bacterium]